MIYNDLQFLMKEIINKKYKKMKKLLVIIAALAVFAGQTLANPDRKSVV